VARSNFWQLIDNNKGILSAYTGHHMSIFHLNIN